MKEIKVNASSPYSIFLGENILCDIGNELKKIVPICKVAIITDDNVYSLYYKTVSDSLTSVGYVVSYFVFKSGETSKNLDTYQQILSFLVQNGLIRSDIILSLGGGVVGDTAGFAAATYMRGIGHIQVPTTLLSQIDSSIGGKTAINLPSGKNLVGAFYQPRAVYIDASTLATLHNIDWQNGLGEGLKYVVLEGGRLLEIAKQNILTNLEEFIELCIDCKRRIVEKDEMENGVRRLLNLGHTLGHAMEKLSDYSLPHGICVAKGLAKISEISEKKGWLNLTDYKEIFELLEKYGFVNANESHKFIDTGENREEKFTDDESKYIKHKSDTIFEYNIKQAIEAIKMDKKANAQGITFVIPFAIGDCRLVDVKTEELSAFII